MAATLAEAQASYLDNADYVAENSVAKARSFLTACNQLLVLLPSAISHGGAGGLQWSLESIANLRATAEKWLAVHDTTYGGARGGVRYSSFEELR